MTSICRAVYVQAGREIDYWIAYIGKLSSYLSLDRLAIDPQILCKYNDSNSLSFTLQDDLSMCSSFL